MKPKWHNEHNARLYNEYVQTYPLYREAARQLLALAPIQAGMTLVDLACGTGVLTAQISQKWGQTCQILAVDASAAMLKYAQSKPALSGTVRFYQLLAEDLGTVLPATSVDVVLCNCAFWQMEIKDTLSVILQLLKPGGSLLFNRLQRPPAPREDPSHPTPSLRLCMLEIAQQEYGYVSQPPSKPVFKDLPVEKVKQLIEEAGFTLSRYYVPSSGIKRTAEDLYAFLKIPSITVLPGLNYATRIEILNQTFQRLHLSPSEIVEITPWEYYLLQK